MSTWAAGWALALVAAQGAGGGAATAVPEADGFLLDLQDTLSDAEVDAFASAWSLRLRPGSVFTARDRTYLLDHADAQLLRVLAADPRVEAAEANVVYGLWPGALDESPGEAPVPTENLPKGFPDDPLFKSQWHMSMIGMEQAWKAGQGKGAVVAVIDTGVTDGRGKFARVPDLEGTEFVPGYDFVNDTAQPDDDHGHGTHVAGTIAQKTHNAFGVAGVAPQARIMPLKVLSKQGWGTAADIAAAIRFAADNGAHVINMSLGGGGYSAAMAAAVKYAHGKGVTVVCAAGNTGRGRVEYPAAYPGALAVSALGPDGKRAWYSSYGKETFIAAPGGDTRVDLNKDGIADGVLQDTIAEGDPNRHGFFPYQGTSMATPHVAGVAALIVGRGVKDPDKVAEILASTAHKRDDRLQFGNGALNAAGAMAALDARESSRAAWLLGMVATAWALARRRAGRSAARAVAGMGVAGWAVAVLWGVGLVPLRWVGVDAGAWAEPLMGLDAGLWGGPSAVMASALWAWLAAALLLGVRRARGVLMGLAVGSAAFLWHAAFSGGVDVAGIPGVGAWDTAWLVVQGALVLWLAGLLARR